MMILNIRKGVCVEELLVETDIDKIKINRKADRK